MNDDREMNEGQEARSRTIQEVLSDGEFPPEPSVELQLAYALRRVLNWSTPFGGGEHYWLPPWLREYAEDAINRFVALWESEEVFRTALRHLPEPGPEVRIAEPEAPRVTTGRTVGTLAQPVHVQIGAHGVFQQPDRSRHGRRTVGTLAPPAWPDEETVRRVAREVCLQVLAELGLGGKTKP